MRAKVLLALLLFIGLATAQFIQLNDTNSGNVGDSYVDSANAGTNYGTATTMKVYTAATYQTSYIAFYLGGLSYPSNAQIIDAELWVWKADTTGVSTTLNCLNTTYFSESTLTWSNRPSALTLQQAVASGTGNGAWISFNVTNGTQAALYNANQTVYLTMNTSSLLWDFYTKDNADTAHRPQLNVTYTSGQLKPATGLVGYWMFDDDSGVQAFDSSGNGNIGTLVNSPTWTTGKNYQTPYALNFPGTNQYVNFGNSSLFNLVSGNNMTISFWIDTTESNTRDIITKFGASWYLIRLGSPTVGKVYAQFYDGSHGADSSSSIAVNDGAWHHVAVEYNAVSGQISIFIDGVDRSVVSDSYASLGVSNIMNLLLADGVASGGYLKGTTDEVKIWNNSQSASQVMAEYTNYCPLNNINITVYNESLASQSVVFNLDASNTTSTFSYNHANPFTDYYCNSTFPSGSATISISNTSFYSPRYYYSTITYAGSYNLSAYLLPLNDLYATSTTIYVHDSSGSSVVGGTVSMYKQISGIWTLMAQDTTDSIGGIYFNLDSQTMYELVATDSCCVQTSLTLQPTQPVYTISMARSSTSNQSIFNFSMSGVSWNVTPSSYIIAGTQNFNLSIYNTNNDFEFWGMKVSYNGSQQYISNQTTSLGGAVNYTMNASDTTDNSINVSIFFKRINGTYFDPTYQYWGYSPSVYNYTLLNAFANIGTSGLSPLTKGIIAVVFITCIAGYVGTAVSFSGGVVLELLGLWFFNSMGYIEIVPLLMLTLIGAGLIYNRHFALTPVG
jgi:hypothetical protein